MYIRFLQPSGREDWTLLFAGVPAELPTQHSMSVRLLRTAARKSFRPLQQH